MIILFNLVYLFLMVVGSPWVVYRMIWLGKNRRGFAQRMWGQSPYFTGDQECLWLHAVSVGEVQLLAPIIRQLCEQYPNWRLAISTTTESGYDVARRMYPNHPVFFAPLDFSWAVRRTMRRLQARAVVLVELELWPNLLQIAAQRRIPVVVINGRLSDRSFSRYQWVRPLVARMLRNVSTIAAQSPEYAERFLRLGARPESLSITGNIKFDGAFGPERSALGQCLRKSFRLNDDELILVAGSTQPEEDLMAIEAYGRLQREFPKLRLVVVPRHLPNVEGIKRLLEQQQLPFVLRSQLQQLTSAELRQRPVIVVDLMGELGGWWSLAQIAYVGGSMGKRGGQNMIEPAAQRAAVAFGPRTENFRDVVGQLLRHDAAVVIHNQQDFEGYVRQAARDPGWRQDLGNRAYDVVERQQGATQRTCQLIARYLSPPPAVSPRARRAA